MAMPKALGELAKLDRNVHEPVRLALLTALTHCASADFTFLVRALELTAGNLNTHLTTLEQAGLIRIDKQIRGKTARTTVSLTDAGTEAITCHWQQLDALRSTAARVLPGLLRVSEEPA
jgi:DNA-binding MarR family transcriptional regulator